MNLSKLVLFAACAAFLLTACAKQAEPPGAATASGATAGKQAPGDAAPSAATADPAGAAARQDSPSGERGAGGTGTVSGDSGALTEAGGAPAPVVSAPRMRSNVKTGHTLKTVYFTFDGYTLDAATQAELIPTADWLRRHPHAVVRVAGHADERGAAEYNLGLGQRRAESVRSFLVAAGIAERNLRPVSFGEEVPAREGRTEQAWQANRRVEFTVLDDTVARR